MAQAFRDLVVWQKAVQMTTLIYRATQTFPREEIYGLASQMRRAAVAIPSNIAEGHGRITSGECKQFMGIARGSNFELQTQIEIARSLGIGDAKLLDQADSLSHEVGKMIFGLLESMNRTQ